MASVLEEFKNSLEQEILKPVQHRLELEFDNYSYQTTAELASSFYRGYLKHGEAVFDQFHPQTLIYMFTKMNPIRHEFYSWFKTNDKNPSKSYIEFIKAVDDKTPIDDLVDHGRSQDLVEYNTRITDTKILEKIMKGMF